MKKILITGASGFIGTALLNVIPKSTVISYGRTKPNSPDILFKQGLIERNTDYTSLFKRYRDIHTIIHTAARVHVMNENSSDSLTSFRNINTFGTTNLAHQAAKFGVKRFIYMSSIGVLGNQNTIPFSHTSTPNPIENYAKSKLEAEVGLQKIARESNMEIVIIRPPLVYGPNAPGNFGKLIKLIQTVIPLPLGSIHNKRSLVALDNLVDLIITCIDHPKAANQTFLVSDDTDVSTTELLQKMAQAMGKKSWLLPIPEAWLRACAKIIGKEDISSRLCGSLQVDIRYTKDTLGWKPPITMEEQLAKIV